MMLQIRIRGRHRVSGGPRARRASRWLIDPIKAIDPNAETATTSGSDADVFVTVLACIPKAMLPVVFSIMKFARWEYAYAPLELTWVELPQRYDHLNN